ncbi:MAG: trimeric autotransporter adhesin [Thermoanaerobaculia bacterium]|jgi:sugar lactone lactonase YvrE|nr:trimeric autotransporter adhesin [Thermoanaerobaculia bacterium]
MPRAFRRVFVALLFASAVALHAQSIVTVAGGGSDDGLPATQVGLYGVSGLAFDRAGNLYFAETNANLVRRLNVDGTVSTLAGTGGAGYAGDGFKATRATLNSPTAVAVDASGNIYIADRANELVRKIDAATGIISRFAGGGADREDHTIDGAADGAVLKQPFGLWLDGNNLYVTESAYNGERIRRIDLTTKTITTVAGAVDGSDGYAGDGGPALAALLRSPTAVAVDTSGNIYVADNGNEVVRRIDAVTKNIETYAGGGTLERGDGDGGSATLVKFEYLGALAFDSDGNLLITHQDRVRRVDKTSRKISTIGLGISISYGMALAKDGSILVASDDGTIKRFVSGSTDPLVIAGGGSYLGDGLLATAAVLRGPRGLAVAADGTLYIADSVNTVVRRVDSNGVISTYAGITGHFYQDGGDGLPATEIAIGGVADVALDAAGNLYIADPHNNVIRKVDATTHLNTTVAGGGDPPGGNEGLPARSARLQGISGIFVDPANNLYIADANANRIWRVDAATQIIRTFAGNGSNGFGGDGGAATAASLSEPSRAVVDPSGNVIIADSGNAALRKVTPDGKISTILRGVSSNDPSFGDGGAAADAYAEPAHIAIDPRNGDIYIADRGPLRVRKIDAATGKISTVAGSGTSYVDADFSGDDGRATEAKMNFPFGLSGVAIDRAGDVFVSDSRNNRVRAVFACTTVGAPILSAPGDGAQTSTAPALAWRPVPGAFRYDVRLDTAAQPSRVVASDVSETSFTPSNLAPGTKYYWQVVAKGDSFCTPQSKTASPIASFTTASGCGVASFNLIAPAAGAQNAGDSSGVTLSWEAAVGASSYDVYVGGSNPPPLAATVSGTSYKAVISGQAFWFVVAHAACDGTKTSSTPIRSFSTTNAASCDVSPTLAIATPGAGATNVSTTVDLAWTANVDFDSFDVYFGSVASPPLLRSQLSGKTRSLTLPSLTTGTTYYWRVVGKSSCLQGGQTSTPVAAFTTRTTCAAPGAPSFQFVPTAATAGSTYAIVWSPASGLDADGGYLVERATSSSFSNPETQVTTSAAAAFVANSAGTYYHRVRALPSCDPNLSGPPSEVRSVAVSQAPPNVIFTLQPRAVVSPIGERIEDHPTTFALENLSSLPVQIFIGQQELNGSPPFFRIVEDAAFVTLEPRKPRTFTIKFGGPPSNVAGSYQAVVFVASTGTGLSVTPYTFVNLKVGGGTAAAPQFIVDGLPSDYAAFNGFSGDDSTRPSRQVTIRNPGTSTMDLAAEIGPEAWLVPENGWNAPLAAGASRTINLFTRRTLAPNGSALPRYTYFTVRTKDGTSARLLVQDNDGIAVSTGRTTSLDSSARSFIVPEVVSGTSSGGHRTVTRMRLTNLGGDSVQAELLFTPSGSDGFDASSAQRVVIVVPANDVVTITDPAVQLFGRTPPQSGQIEVRLPRERIGLVSVRASIVVLGGNGGFETPVVSRGDGARIGTPLVINLLPQSNVSLVLAETSGADAASVRLTMSDANGQVTSTQTQQLARYGMVRVSGLTATRIVIDVQSGGGSVVGIATLAASNGESGATFLSRPVEERIAGAALARALWKGALVTTPAVSVTTVVPVLTSPASAGATPSYSTALGFIASSSAAATFSATFHNSSGVGPTPKVDITVPAGGTRFFSDASKEMFGNAASGQGSIFVSAPSVTKVYAVLQNGPSGSGGTLTPLATLPLQTTLSDAISGASSSAQKPLSFDGLEQSQDPSRGTRWLVFLNEVAGGSGSISVRLYEAGNRNAAIGQKDFSIAPYQQLRLDTVFSELGLTAADRLKDRTNVQVVVVATSGSARVTASAMSVDNVSGDTHVFALLPVVGAGTPNVTAVAPVVTAPKPAADPRHRAVKH